MQGRPLNAGPSAQCRLQGRFFLLRERRNVSQSHKRIERVRPLTPRRKGLQSQAHTRRCPRERVAIWSVPPENMQKTWRKRWRACATTDVAKRGSWTVEATVEHLEPVRRPNCFWAPATSCFQGNDHQTTSVTLKKLGVLPFFLRASSSAHDAVCHSRTRTRQARSSQSATQSDVDCQLGSVMDWETRSNNFDSSFVVCRDRDVHVDQLHIATNRCSGFPAHPGECALRCESSCAQSA